MTLQHSASSAAHNFDAYRNSQPLGNITTEPKYPHPLTTNNRDGPTGVNHSQQVGSYDLKKNKDMRLPGQRSTQVEDLPSDISDDEWGEIQKFGQRLHEEKQR